MVEQPVELTEALAEEEEEKVIAKAIITVTEFEDDIGIEVHFDPDPTEAQKNGEEEPFGAHNLAAYGALVMIQQAAANNELAEEEEDPE